MFETHGPVPAFLEAVQARDVRRIMGLLSVDVRLFVPPLHFTRRGGPEVGRALAGFLEAFGDLRYDVRSRYVVPGTVTDEAVLVGRQTGPFLGAPPAGGRRTVAARVIIEHDAATVTDITFWPDVSALRVAVDGVSRMIDLTKVGDASGMVAALRASIPPTQAKLIIGSAREPLSPAGPTATAAELPGSVAGEAGPLIGRPVPKPPVPRLVRRRRALVAGTAMIALSTALTAWVAMGALQSGSAAPQATVLAAGDTLGSVSAADGPPPGPGGSGPGRTGSDAAGSMTAGSMSAGSISAGSMSAGSAGAIDVTPAHLSPGTTVVQLFTTELFFATDKYALRPAAVDLLSTYMADAVRQHRAGRIEVYGFTDNVGAPGYNLQLSRRRATSVAQELRADPGAGRFTIRPVGRGVTAQFGDNSSEATRMPNRCVVIVFPAAAGTGAAPAAPAAPGAPGGVSTSD